LFREFVIGVIVAIFFYIFPQSAITTTFISLFFDEGLASKIYIQPFAD